MNLERSVKRAIAPVTSPAAKRAIIGARDRGLGAVAIVRHRVSNGRLAPRLVIAGAQKAGTTFLHHQLERHPRVRSPLTKELHFFDDHYQRGTGWYLGHFPRDHGDGSTALESSPGYMFHPHAIERLDRALPEARVIVLLRDPTARAFSHFLHERRLGFEDEPDFETALELETERVEPDLARLRADPSHVGFSWRHHSYFARGCYVEQIRRCEQVLGSDRVLVLRSEDMFSEPHTTLERVHDFAGLEPHDDPQLAPNDMSAPESARLAAHTEAELRARFAPHNEELAAHLGTETWW